MPTFRGTTDTFSEFEHQLENDLHPMSNSSAEKAKLQDFQTFFQKKEASSTSHWLSPRRQPGAMY